VIAVSAIAAHQCAEYDHFLMGFLSWLFGRERGAAEKPSQEAGPRLDAPKPTPTMRPLEAPKPTPTTRPLGGQERTAGTPSYGAPHGTPSTQRIHNPTRPGR